MAFVVKVKGIDIIHGVYNTREEAEHMAQWIYNRYRPTTIVECDILTEWPDNARSWLIAETDAWDDNNLLRPKTSRSKTSRPTQEHDPNGDD